MAGELIMIVEDNERNLKLLRDLLGVDGYRTVEARSGEEAVLLARAERPQLVLMDIQLPGMDGVAALRELRGFPESAATPVVAVTAFAMKEDHERFLAAGFDAYLEKPVNVRQLRSCVASYLGAGAAGTQL
jgi:two-component system, cell cycle response regulator DivK